MFVPTAGGPCIEIRSVDGMISNGMSILYYVWYTVIPATLFNISMVSHLRIAN